VTVPCIWDRVTERIVTNNYPDITIDFETEFTAFHRAGFSTTQAKYEEAVIARFARLDWLEARLATRRYLVGELLTEADIRLFTTLVRFDAVYVGPCAGSWTTSTCGAMPATSTSSRASATPSTSIISSGTTT
jgi:putative glutathione S-transferase